MSMCATHHSATKQRMESGKGAAPGCDPSGMPLDPTHPWHPSRQGR